MRFLPTKAFNHTALRIVKRTKWPVYRRLLSRSINSHSGAILWSVVLKSFAHSALAQVKAGTNLLTDRELEVFTLIGRGAGILEMAQELGVSLTTVETHRMRIKQKLHLGSAVELRKYAVHSMSRGRA